MLLLLTDASACIATSQVLNFNGRVECGAWQGLEPVQEGAGLVVKGRVGHGVSRCCKITGGLL